MVRGPEGFEGRLNLAAGGAIVTPCGCSGATGFLTVVPRGRMVVTVIPDAAGGANVLGAGMSACGTGVKGLTAGFDPLA
jgi:hypothetical protein